VEGHAQQPALAVAGADGADLAGEIQQRLGQHPPLVDHLDQAALLEDEHASAAFARVSQAQRLGEAVPGPLELESDARRIEAPQPWSHRS
jgi:hypothetical protein